MFSFYSKYFVYRELKRASQKLNFCFKWSDTGTGRILGNILYVIAKAKGKASFFMSVAGNNLHLTKSAYHLSDLAGQTSSVVMRIPLLRKNTAGSVCP